MFKVSLMDISGKEETDVAIWDSFPNFTELTVGMQIEGDVVVKQSGQYVNKTLYPPKASQAPKTASGYTRSPSAMNIAMKTKQDGIKQSQENKELGIKVSSTMRMAVDIVTSFMDKDASEQFTKDKIKQWREWLWSEWEKEEKDFPPFN